jgi:phage recombination protein Bet
MNQSDQINESTNSMPLIKGHENDLFAVLSNSLYVGAQPESIKMVLDYCRAAGLDPMLKPVHIVPMYCSTGQKTKDGKDIKSMRDVIMPGIGLYRIQASRTEQLAGVSEPEFGENVTEELGSIEITYPLWCKITVKRLTKAGYVAEFTAKEFWKENYATKSRDDKAPNSMWMKRPYGQLSKCAEAQALRKAFHELGAQPTAEEMEGKEVFVIEEIEDRPPQLPNYTDEKLDMNIEAWETAIKSGKHTPESIINMISTKHTLSDDQKKIIRLLKKEDENENS